MRNLLLAILSAVLLSAGWLGCGSVPVLIGFIPLLVISAGYEKGRAGFWKTFGFTAIALGLWSAITTWWIGMAPGAWIGSVLSVLITVTLFGAVFMLFHFVSKRAPKALAYTLLVSAWIAAEYLYTTGEVSFPWLVLGNGFAGDIKLVQWYDTTGVFGGSLWVWLCNILIYHALRARMARAWIVPAAVLLLPIGISLVKYYTYSEPAETITVTSVQPNFDPYTVKFYAEEDYQIGIMLELAAQAPADVDYIIFPETAVEVDREERLMGEESRTLAPFRQLLRDKYPGTTMVVGATTHRLYLPDEKPSHTARNKHGYYYDVYNSAVAVDTSMTVDVHHKSMLLIGVEKMPYAGRFGWLDALILDMGGTTGNLGSDKVRKVFAGDGHRYAAPVCWEGVFGEYLSEFIRKGANAIFIISNDGWWADTQGHRQLFKFARLRAVESRRAVARSANTGTSGFINQRGDVMQKIGWDERAAITQDIALNDKMTFYVRYGDYIARISVLVFGLCVLYFIAYTFRKRNLLQK